MTYQHVFTHVQQNLPAEFPDKVLVKMVVHVEGQRLLFLFLLMEALHTCI